MRSNSIAAIALTAALALSACHKRMPTAALPPVPAPPLVSPPVIASSAPLAMDAPALPPPSPPEIAWLDEADRAFVSGSYEQAARGYERYLRAGPAAGQRDHALFHLALAYALRPAPSTDWTRAAATFKELIDHYPDSPFRAPADLILSLRANLDQAAADSRQRDQRIKQLGTELDRLKKIDADRGKRR